MAQANGQTTAARRDKPWIFRTYAGHSTARESNKLYRQNLAKGQTGLSIAFDLPTQTGFDSDHTLARGEVGKVGVAISHIGDMRALFEDIPLASMNTSMTINATAPWLMALYIAVADEQGAPRAELQGTTQNDIIKEYLARGSYVFPPERLAQADQGHDPVRRPRDAEVEPDERLLLPPAGSGRDAGPGAFLRARHGDRRARTGPPIGRGRRSGVRGGRRPDFVLRQRRHALRHRARQDARLRRIVGRDHPRPLRRAGSRPSAASATASRSIRSASPSSSPRTTPIASSSRCCRWSCRRRRARARRATAGLERGARPAAAVRPAMVAAPAADHGLRDRPARVRRHFRRQQGGRSAGRQAEERGASGNRRDRRDGRRGQGDRDGRAEGEARRIQHAPARGDRARRADRRRRQRLHQFRALAADRGREFDPGPLGRSRGRAGGRARGVAG